MISGRTLDSKKTLYLWIRNRVSFFNSHGFIEFVVAAQWILLNNGKSCGGASHVSQECNPVESHQCTVHPVETCEYSRIIHSQGWMPFRIISVVAILKSNAALYMFPWSSNHRDPEDHHL